MTVYVWTYGKYFTNIVLHDGKATYWNEDMTPSTGYQEAILKARIGKFTFIGIL